MESSSSLDQTEIIYTPFDKNFLDEYHDHHHEAILSKLPQTGGGDESYYYRYSTLHIPETMKKNALAAGVAAGFTSSLFNPLDCLRVRWQVLKSADFLGLMQYGEHVIKSEGLVHGLWRPGLVYNACGMGISAAIRFSTYEIVRDSVVFVRSDDASSKKNYFDMLVAGVVTGSVGYSIATPFHLFKTTLQAEMVHQQPQQTQTTILYQNNNIIDRIKYIVEREGIRGLWKGAGPLTIRGSLFTAGQMLGYDGFKTTCLKNNHLVEKDGPLLHGLSSICASFCASLFATPADFLMAKVMTSSSQISSKEIILQVYNEYGILGYWRGFGIFFIRLCPVMLTYSTIYEQIRKTFGLGYLS